MSGFAHTGDDDAAAAIQTDFAGLDEIGADRSKKAADRVRFDIHDVPGPV
jgi:hypothetical protein